MNAEDLIALIAGGESYERDASDSLDALVRRGLASRESVGEGHRWRLSAAAKLE